MLNHYLLAIQVNQTYLLHTSAVIHLACSGYFNSVLGFKNLFYPMPVEPLWCQMSNSCWCISLSFLFLQFLMLIVALVIHTLCSLHLKIIFFLEVSHENFKDHNVSMLITRFLLISPIQRILSWVICNTKYLSCT